MKTNSKYFYSYAKKFTRIPGSVGTLEDKNARLKSDSVDKAKILGDQYSSQFTIPDPEYIPSNENLAKWEHDGRMFKSYE